ncbi:MAG: hypothetical protein N2747_09400 [Chitinophagaceae bacterium]|nr:hypothetical protein [Chitinophagaceae bacterium]
MVNKLLFPHRYKKAGWLMLIPATLFGFFLLITGFDSLPVNARVFAIHHQTVDKAKWFRSIDTNITVTVAGILFIP